MKKVLIVSLRAGNGHVKAAEAIEKAIGELNRKDLVVKNIDLLDYSTILSKKFYDNLYLDIVSIAPKFYRWLYYNIDSSTTSFRMIFDRLNVWRFKELVEEFEPDYVVCTHFVPANLLTYWRGRYSWKTKVFLTVTDYDSHTLWVDKGVDQYFVANEDVKNYLISEGIRRDIIRKTGIPIDPKFSKKYDRGEISKKNYLENEFTITIFAGGFKATKISRIFNKIIKEFPNIQIIIVCGRSENLYDALNLVIGKNKNKKIKILKFINNIEEIMSVSDLIITKAGGLTVSECLAMGVPMIISNPIPGQEEENSDFLLKSNAAIRADKADEIVAEIKKVLNNPDILIKLKSGIRKIAKKDAAEKIVEQIV